MISLFLLVLSLVPVFPRELVYGQINTIAGTRHFEVYVDTLWKTDGFSSNQLKVGSTIQMGKIYFHMTADPSKIGVRYHDGLGRNPGDLALTLKVDSIANGYVRLTRSIRYDSYNGDFCKRGYPCMVWIESCCREDERLWTNYENSFRIVTLVQTSESKRFISLAAEADPVKQIQVGQPTSFFIRARGGSGKNVRFSLSPLGLGLSGVCSSNDPYAINGPGSKRDCRGIEYPDGLSIDLYSGQVSWTPDTPGIYSVQVLVSEHSSPPGLDASYTGTATPVVYDSGNCYRFSNLQGNGQYRHVNGNLYQSSNSQNLRNQNAIDSYFRNELKNTIGFVTVDFWIEVIDTPRQQCNSGCSNSGQICNAHNDCKGCGTVRPEHRCTLPETPVFTGYSTPNGVLQDEGNRVTFKYIPDNSAEFTVVAESPDGLETFLSPNRLPTGASFTTTSGSSASITVSGTYTDCFKDFPICFVATNSAGIKSTDSLCVVLEPISNSIRASGDGVTSITIGVTTFFDVFVYPNQNVNFLFQHGRPNDLSLVSTSTVGFETKRTYSYTFTGPDVSSFSLGMGFGQSTSDLSFTVQVFKPPVDASKTLFNGFTGGIEETQITATFTVRNSIGGSADVSQLGTFTAEVILNGNVQSTVTATPESAGSNTFSVTYTVPSSTVSTTFSVRIDNSDDSVETFQAQTISNLPLTTKTFSVTAPSTTFQAGSSQVISFSRTTQSSLSQTVTVKIFDTTVEINGQNTFSTESIPISQTTAGTYPNTFSITGTYLSPSISKSITIVPGPFSIANSQIQGDSTFVAGTQGSFSLLLRDSYGNTITSNPGSSFSYTVSSSGGTGSLSWSAETSRLVFQLGITKTGSYNVRVSGPNGALTPIFSFTVTTAAVDLTKTVYTQVSNSLTSVVEKSSNTFYAKLHDRFMNVYYDNAITVKASINFGGSESSFTSTADTANKRYTIIYTAPVSSTTSSFSISGSVRLSGSLSFVPTNAINGIALRTTRFTASISVAASYQAGSLVVIEVTVSDGSLVSTMNLNIAGDDYPIEGSGSTSTFSTSISGLVTAGRYTVTLTGTNLLEDQTAQFDIVYSQSGPFILTHTVQGDSFTAGTTVLFSAIIKDAYGNTVTQQQDVSIEGSVSGSAFTGGVVFDSSDKTYQLSLHSTVAARVSYQIFIGNGIAGSGHFDYSTAELDPSATIFGGPGADTSIHHIEGSIVSLTVRLFDIYGNAIEGPVFGSYPSIVTALGSTQSSRITSTYRGDKVYGLDYTVPATQTDTTFLFHASIQGTQSVGIGQVTDLIVISKWYEAVWNLQEAYEAGSTIVIDIMPLKKLSSTAFLFTVEDTTHSVLEGDGDNYTSTVSGLTVVGSYVFHLEETFLLTDLTKTVTIVPAVSGVLSVSVSRIGSGAVSAGSSINFEALVTDAYGNVIDQDLGIIEYTAAVGDQSFAGTAIFNEATKKYSISLTFTKSGSASISIFTQTDTWDYTIAVQPGATDPDNTLVYERSGDTGLTSGSEGAQVTFVIQPRDEFNNFITSFRSSDQFEIQIDFDGVSTVTPTQLGNGIYLVTYTVPDSTVTTTFGLSVLYLPSHLIYSENVQVVTKNFLVTWDLLSEYVEGSNIFITVSTTDTRVKSFVFKLNGSPFTVNSNDGFRQSFFISLEDLDIGSYQVLLEEEFFHPSLSESFQVIQRVYENTGLDVRRIGSGPVTAGDEILFNVTLLDSEGNRIPTDEVTVSYAAVLSHAEGSTSFTGTGVFADGFYILTCTITTSGNARFNFSSNDEVKANRFIEIIPGPTDPLKSVYFEADGETGLSGGKEETVVTFSILTKDVFGNLITTRNTGDQFFIQTRLESDLNALETAVYASNGIFKATYTIPATQLDGTFDILVSYQKDANSVTSLETVENITVYTDWFSLTSNLETSYTAGSSFSVLLYTSDESSRDLTVSIGNTFYVATSTTLPLSPYRISVAGIDVADVYDLVVEAQKLTDGFSSSFSVVPNTQTSRFVITSTASQSIVAGQEALFIGYLEDTYGNRITGNPGSITVTAALDGLNSGSVSYNSTSNTFQVSFSFTKTGTAVYEIRNRGVLTTNGNIVFTPAATDPLQTEFVVLGDELGLVGGQEESMVLAYFRSKDVFGNAIPEDRPEDSFYAFTRLNSVDSGNVMAQFQSNGYYAFNYTIPSSQVDTVYSLHPSYSNGESVDLPVIEDLSLFTNWFSAEWDLQDTYRAGQSITVQLNVSDDSTDRSVSVSLNGIVYQLEYVSGAQLYSGDLGSLTITGNYSVTVTAPKLLSELDQMIQILPDISGVLQLDVRRIGSGSIPAGTHVAVIAELFDRFGNLIEDSSQIVGYTVSLDSSVVGSGLATLNASAVYEMELMFTVSGRYSIEVLLNSASVALFEVVYVPGEVDPMGSDVFEAEGQTGLGGGEEETEIEFSLQMKDVYDNLITVPTSLGEFYMTTELNTISTRFDALYFEHGVYHLSYDVPTSTQNTVYSISVYFEYFNGTEVLVQTIPDLSVSTRSFSASANVPESFEAGTRIAFSLEVTSGDNRTREFQVFQGDTALLVLQENATFYTVAADASSFHVAQVYTDVIRVDALDLLNPFNVSINIVASDVSSVEATVPTKVVAGESVGFNLILKDRFGNTIEREESPTFSVLDGDSNTTGSTAFDSNTFIHSSAFTLEKAGDAVLEVYVEGIDDQTFLIEVSPAAADPSKAVVFESEGELGLSGGFEGATVVFSIQSRDRFDNLITEMRSDSYFTQVLYLNSQVSYTAVFVDSLFKISYVLPNTPMGVDGEVVLLVHHEDVDTGVINFVADIGGIFVRSRFYSGTLSVASNYTAGDLISFTVSTTLTTDQDISGIVASQQFSYSFNNGTYTFDVFLEMFEIAGVYPNAIQISDDYLIESLYGDIVIVPGPVLLSSSVVSVPLGEVPAGVSFTATIRLFDQFGNAISESGIVSFDVSSMDGPSNGTVEVNSVSGMYELSLTPQLVGDIQLRFTMTSTGDSIGDEVYIVTVIPGATDPFNVRAFETSSSGLTGGQIENTISFHLQSRDAFGNDIFDERSDSYLVEVFTDLVKQSTESSVYQFDGIFNVSYTVPGISSDILYSLKLYYLDTSTNADPVFIRTISDLEASLNAFAVEINVSPQYIAGERMNLTLEIYDGPSTELSLSVYFSAEIEFQTVTQTVAAEYLSGNTYFVSLDPIERAGTYRRAVTALSPRISFVVPRDITVIPAQVDASTSTIEVEGSNTVAAGKMATLVVTLYDRFGNRIFSQNEQIVYEAVHSETASRSGSASYRASSSSYAFQVLFTKTGRVEVYAFLSDDRLISGRSAGFSVQPGPLSLSQSVLALPDAFIAGEEFVLSITAYDAYRNDRGPSDEFTLELSPLSPGNDTAVTQRSRNANIVYLGITVYLAGYWSVNIKASLPRDTVALPFTSEILFVQANQIHVPHSLVTGTGFQGGNALETVLVLVQGSDVYGNAIRKELDHVFVVQISSEVGSTVDTMEFSDPLTDGFCGPIALSNLTSDEQILAGNGFWRYQFEIPLNNRIGVTDYTVQVFYVVRENMNSTAYELGTVPSDHVMVLGETASTVSYASGGKENGTLLIESMSTFIGLILVAISGYGGWRMYRYRSKYKNARARADSAENVLWELDGDEAILGKQSMFVTSTGAAKTTVNPLHPAHKNARILKAFYGQ